MSQTGKNQTNQDDATIEDPELAGIADVLDELAAGESAEQGEEAPEAPEQPDPVELLSEQIAELEDKVLRQAAEMQNLRRRAEREKAEATLYAASNFARDMLSVSDNMDRALDAVTDDQRAAADAVTTNLMQGVELVQRELLNTFERHGIRRITPLGERFDPNLHQAMFEVPDEQQESGTIVQVVQPGFVIGERVLRPAMVGIAKGGPKPAARTETGEPTGKDAPEAACGGAQETKKD